MDHDRGESADGSRDGGSGPADGGTASGADHTQPVNPRSEPDETRPIDPRSGSAPDETRAFEARGEPDQTRRQAAAAAWSGRAGVPPPRPAAGPAEPSGWGEYEAPSGRPWWMPILIGLLAFLFLGVLAFAFWLATESDDRDGPVGPSPSATSAQRSPTPTATTGRPTPSRTSAAPVPVPPMVGLSLAEAQELLDELGLESRLEFRVSNQPTGTVLDTDPGAGVLVVPGDTVTLVVAQPPPSPPDQPTTAAPGPTSPGR